MLLVLEYCDRGSLHDGIMDGMLRSTVGTNRTNYNNMVNIPAPDCPLACCSDHILLRVYASRHKCELDMYCLVLIGALAVGSEGGHMAITTLDTIGSCLLLTALRILGWAGALWCTDRGCLCLSGSCWVAGNTAAAAALCRARCLCCALPWTLRVAWPIYTAAVFVMGTSAARTCCWSAVQKWGHHCGLRRVWLTLGEPSSAASLAK